MFFRSHKLKVPQQQSKPIYLVSMASFPNFGDELIAARWLSWLAEHRPDTDVWLDVREPGMATSLFGGLHPRLRVTNTLFRAIHEHLHGDQRTPADKVRQLSSPRYDLGLIDLREAGIVHLLGGGFINREWEHNRLLVDAMRAVAEISGARLYATGQGLMPRINEDFTGFDYVSVRDQPSAEAIGIEQGLDDAFLMRLAPTVDRPAFCPETAELYICVQSDAVDDGAHEAMVSFARAQIEKLGIARERTRYVEAIPGADYPGYSALKDLIADDGFIPFSDFWRSGFQFGHNQVWISSRFHHHLVGAVHGARGIALSGKAGYYDVKHGSLIALGTGWRIADLTGTFSLEELVAPADFTRHIETKRAEATHLYQLPPA